MKRVASSRAALRALTFAVFALSLLVSRGAQAADPHPPSFEIEGLVLDRLTERPVPAARIEVEEISYVGFVDSLGRFRLTVPAAGSYRVRALAGGYEASAWERVSLHEGTARAALTIRIEPQLYRVPTVEVRGERVPTDIARPPTRRLLDSEIRRAPGGFQDPVRVLSESRSVESMNEFATILSIRGGEPDQVLFLVDGFDAYNPYRLRIVLGGGLSLANPDVVESVELYAGGFSARYGNRTSGMVHLRTREGDRNHLRSRGTLSLLAASGAIEGPLPGGSGSWIVGARRTYYDLFIHPPAGEGRQYPFLQEGQGRIDWDLAPGHRLTLRASGSDEGVNLILPDESDTGEVVTDAGCGTTTGSIEHRWALGRRTSLTTRFAGLHDRNRIEIHNEEGDVVWADGSIRSNRFSLSQELEVVTSPHVVRIGGQIDRYSCRTVWSKTHDPNPDPFPRPASIDIDGDLTYRAFYLEDVTALRDGWYLSPGIRFDDTGGPTPLQASPRVALRGELPHGLHARLGTGLFLQYADGVQGFSREATLVISSAKDLRPERAFLASAGLSGGAGRFRWDVEAYDRTTEDLLVPADRETYEAVSNGRAHARGIEAEVRLVPAIDGGQGSLFRKMEARLAHGWLRSRFEGGVFPSGTPVSTERTHSFLANVRLPAGSSSWFIATFRATSGAPYTPLVGRLTPWDSGEEVVVPLWGRPLSARMAPYARLDLRFERTIHLFGRNGCAFLEVLNVTNRTNTTSIEWNDDLDERDVVGGIPIVPFLGLTIAE